MDRQIAVVLYVVAMVAIIVGVDLVFFRHRFWERLIVNIGIVLVFIAFYQIFFRPMIAMEMCRRSCDEVAVDRALDERQLHVEGCPARAASVGGRFLDRSS
jgi:uncharacterized membrane protein YfcA